MTALALLLALVGAGSASAAEPTAMLRLDSGFRPLGLPLGMGLGGGLRAGLVAGPVTPFVGGSATMLRVQEIDDRDRSPNRTTLSAWTIQAGARVQVAELEAADTFLVAGTALSNLGGTTLWDPEEGRGYGTRFPVGPGAFAGGGADAWLSDRVSIAVEAGGAWFSGGLTAKDQRGGNVDRAKYRGASLLFAYSSLGLTLWLGGAE